MLVPLKAYFRGAERPGPKAPRYAVMMRPLRAKNEKSRSPSAAGPRPYSHSLGKEAASFICIACWVAMPVLMKA